MSDPTPPVTSHPYNQTPGNYPKDNYRPAKKGKGCFFYGCLSSIFLTVLIIGGSYFGYQYGMNYLFENYSQSTPMILEDLGLSEEEIQLATSKYDSFINNISSSNEPLSLELNSRDINAVISGNKQIKSAGIKARVELNDLVNLKAVYKLPVSGEAKYINVNGKFKLGLQNEELELDIKDLLVAGKPLSESISSQVDKKTKSNISDNPDLADKLKYIESLVISGDSLVIKKKGE